MKKILAWIALAVFCAALVPAVNALRDQAYLQSNLIRLHVVAASDASRDQALKLRVRDAVTAYLAPALGTVSDPEAAKERITALLPGIQEAAQTALQAEGCGDTVQVSLQREAFSRRDYDSFSLPSGVYDALRVVIGPGEGKNWWCVVFPTLCVGAAEFEDRALACGMSGELTDTLRGEEGYEIRFFLLDCLGKIENFFHRA